MVFSRQIKAGFTLLEILVVITIIGLLVVILMSFVNESRAKVRDASRIQTMRELQKAIDVYYDKNGFYPPLTGTTDAVSGSTLVTCADNTTGDAEWCELIAALSPYHQGGIDDPLTTMPYAYYYDADGATPSTYGLMVLLELSANAHLTDTDGGHYCSVGSPFCTIAQMGYEIGDAPKACQGAGGKDWRSAGC